MTGELLPGAIEEGPSPVDIDAEDHLPHALDDRPVARLAVAERLYRGLRSRDRQLQASAMAIQDEAHEADDPGAGADAEGRGDLRGQVGADRRELHDHGRD